METLIKIKTMLDELSHITKTKQQNRLKKCYLLDFSNRYLQLNGEIKGEKIESFLTKKSLHYEIKPNLSFNELKIFVKINIMLDKLFHIRKLKQRKRF